MQPPRRFDVLGFGFVAYLVVGRTQKRKKEFVKEDSENNTIRLQSALKVLRKTLRIAPNGPPQFWHSKSQLAIPDPDKYFSGIKLNSASIPIPLTVPGGIKHTAH